MQIAKKVKTLRFSRRAWPSLFVPLRVEQVDDTQDCRTVKGLLSPRFFSYDAGDWALTRMRPTLSMMTYQLYAPVWSTRATVPPRLDGCPRKCPPLPQ